MKAWKSHLQTKADKERPADKECWAGKELVLFSKTTFHSNTYVLNPIECTTVYRLDFEHKYS